jgi:hypothetical protein
MMNRTLALIIFAIVLIVAGVATIFVTGSDTTTIPIPKPGNTSSSNKNSNANSEDLHNDNTGLRSLNR